ncbi:hypothetical protein [Arthrobacter crystallopoietes]|uniref:hypothetical protein n=1 Tax=Crystallibacter crystallopoietes TaxID=37928 RepID=UPI001111187C|nr:hypothetical protein [Arthrobacter crystallopoietes]
MDNHEIPGWYHHSHNLPRNRSTHEYDVELVPEPGNPYDHRAVALHVDRKRIGYVSASDSSLWHDVVTAYNKRGHAVYARGTPYLIGDRVVSFTVLLPGNRDLVTHMAELGFFEECDRVISTLSPDVRIRITATSRYGIDPADVLLLRSKRHLAPSLNWQEGMDGRSESRYPMALYCRLVELDRIGRLQAQTVRKETAAAAKVERERREAETRALAAERAKALRDNVLQLYTVGATKASIGRQLQCSEHRINRILTAAGIRPTVTANATLRSERAERAQQALRMQREELTRRQIAIQLDCSLETVKALLRDAKFYEDPSSDVHRLALVRTAKDPAYEGLGYEAAAKKAEVTVAKLKEARRDFAVLKALGRV